MSKSIKAEKADGKTASYTMRPWSCNHYPTYSEIEIYVPITGNWEIVADIHDTKGVDAEVLTDFIVRVVNNHERHDDLVGQMVAALELCLACKGPLTWEAEQAADAVIKRYQQSR